LEGEVFQNLRSSEIGTTNTANNGKNYIQSKNDIEPKWPTWTFKSFNDLINQSEEINDLLVVSGGD